MQDFRAHLGEQLDLLRSPISDYDSGMEHAAKAIADRIRLLVKTKGRTTSLLQHLGVQDQLGWIDRGPPAPPRNAVVISFGVCVSSRLDSTQVGRDTSLPYGSSCPIDFIRRRPSQIGGSARS
jgi:hypothetical protein